MRPIQRMSGDKSTNQQPSTAESKEINIDSTVLHCARSATSNSINSNWFQFISLSTKRQVSFGFPYFVSPSFFRSFRSVVLAPLCRAPFASHHNYYYYYFILFRWLWFCFASKINFTLTFLVEQSLRTENRKHEGLFIHFRIRNWFWSRLHGTSDRCGCWVGVCVWVCGEIKHVGLLMKVVQTKRNQNHENNWKIQKHKLYLCLLVWCATSRNRFNVYSMYFQAHAAHVSILFYRSRLLCLTCRFVCWHIQC